MDIYDYAGIKLLKTNHSTIKNNTCSNNQGNGILLYDNCNNNTIIENIVKDNFKFGISFDQGCHNNLIIDNIVDDNTETGISIGSIYTGYHENNNNTIVDNVVTNNFYVGITTGGLYNNFTRNYIYNNTQWGMSLEGMDENGNYTILTENIFVENVFNILGYYSILHGNIFINDSFNFLSILITKEQMCSYTISDTNIVNDGILYYYANEIGLTKANFTGNIGQIIIANCNNSVLSELSFSNESSVEFYYCFNNTLQSINITDEAYINMDYCDQNFITNCNFEDSFGLSLWESNNNTIFANIFKDDLGLSLEGSHYCNITDNVCMDTYLGISISVCNYTIISENYIYNSSIIAISLSGDMFTAMSYNNITNNIIENCTIGINFAMNSTENLIRDNSILNSNDVGIHLEVNCDNNLFYRNALINNNISHAWDEGNFNQWDNGIIGNYWDNYTERGGFDNNNDGIGDINYTIYHPGGAPAANDTKPIYENPIHNGEKIYIDDTGVSALNWTQTALVKYWCTGSGEEHNPYIIKNLDINGSGTGNCILIANSSVYFTIENCTVFNSDPAGGAGIKLDSVNNSLIIDNNCSDNYYGIFLYECYDNLIHNNSMKGAGISSWFSSENNITNNLISGGPIDLYLSNYTNVKNNVVFNSIVGISITFNGIHNYFSGNTISGGSVGFAITGEDNTVYNNTVKFNSAEGGIYLSGKNNSIIMNNVYNNSYGIWVIRGYNHTIIQNTVSNNTYGIALSPPISPPYGEIYENYVINNTLSFNKYGIKIFKSNYSIITKNIVRNNSIIGIMISKSVYSTQNLIYNNSFTGNRIHAVDNGTNNYWNSSLIGNYWDNYTGVDDLVPFGIGDTPYDISGTAGSKDYLPIYKGPSGPSDGTPQPPPGDDDDDDDDDDGFDAVEFFTSPIGLAILGGSIVAAVAFAIIKIKGSGKSRSKEILRIERLRSE
jgi:parallel beta-helix repeat protein